MTVRGAREKAKHGLCSRTTGGKPQLLGARQGRRTEEADLVHTGRAAGLSARHLSFRCPASIPTSGSRCSSSQAGGILGMFNMFAGGGIHRMAIFALNIMPYISASIIIQLLTTVSPHARSPQEGGRVGPQDAQPVHPLSHGDPGRVPVLRHRRRPRRRRQRGRPIPAGPSAS